MQTTVPTAAFRYSPVLELGNDDTPYRLLTKEHVQVRQFDGQEVLRIDAQALTLLCSQAFHDINFYLRPAHLQQLAAILDDPEASENDRITISALGHAHRLQRFGMGAATECHRSAQWRLQRHPWLSRRQRNTRGDARRQ